MKYGKPLLNLVSLEALGFNVLLGKILGEYFLTALRYGCRIIGIQTLKVLILTEKM